MILVFLMYCCLIAADCKPAEDLYYLNGIDTITSHPGVLKLIHVFVPTKEPLFPQFWQSYKGKFITRRKRDVPKDEDLKYDQYKHVIMIDDIKDRKNKKQSAIDNFVNMNVEMVAAEDIPFMPLFYYRLKQKRRNQRLLERQKHYKEYVAW